MNFPMLLRFDARLRSHRLAALLLVALLSGACAIVPQNRRRYITNAGMPAKDDALELRARRKLHVSREGAAGGDGKPAGGGCGCGN